MGSKTCRVSRPEAKEREGIKRASVLITLAPAQRNGDGYLSTERRHTSVVWRDGGCGRDALQKQAKRSRGEDVRGEKQASEVRNTRKYPKRTRGGLDSSLETGSLGVFELQGPVGRPWQ